MVGFSNVQLSCTQDTTYLSSERIQQTFAKHTNGSGQFLKHFTSEFFQVNIIIIPLIKCENTEKYRKIQCSVIFVHCHALNGGEINDGKSLKKSKDIFNYNLFIVIPKELA